ncbi:MAG: hypothetical protein E8A46_00260 [Bradyrhizobium sp.]|uniref:hypothetical protein n=1 Tax=Bradyrhizobium sp. TaxID=376 RepID=UPI00121C023D|nr:hypothetical protein [Bradyrhizobium sp.]THD58010.1 MAG: hypothetical protein E8A46_00260 [Bradyrhizobium sp.]
MHFVQMDIRGKTPVRITGLAKDGKIETVTGLFQTVQFGQTAFEGYPVRVNMLPSPSNPLILANSN